MPPKDSAKGNIPAPPIYTHPNNFPANHGTKQLPLVTTRVDLRHYNYICIKSKLASSFLTSTTIVYSRSSKFPVKLGKRAARTGDKEHPQSNFSSLFLTPSICIIPQQRSSRPRNTTASSASSGDKESELTYASMLKWRRTANCGSFPSWGAYQDNNNGR